MFEKKLFIMLLLFNLFFDCLPFEYFRNKIRNKISAVLTGF